MTQISDKRKSLVDWETAVLHASLLSNPKPIWTIFPPKKSGGRCYHFPTETNYKNKVEDCLKRNPKHSLGFIVNPTIEKPADYGSKKEDLNAAGFVKTWGASNSHIKGAKCLFTEGDGDLPLEKQIEVVFDALCMPASFITFSGGKSLHFYFLLSELINKERFTKMQKQLQIICNNQNQDFGADKSIHSPAQVMRAVGGVHPSGNKTVFYRISQGWGEQKGILIYNPEFINGLLFGTRTKFQEQKEIPPATPAKKNKWKSEFTTPEFRNYLEEGNWFTRLPMETKIELAIEMLGFVVNRSVTGKGERNDCINILAGLKRHFGGEVAAEICIRAKWESEFWNPVKELPTIYEPIKSDIGCLVWHAKNGGGRKWVYEKSKVINKEKNIKLEDIFPAELSKNLRVITKFLPYPDYLIISTFLPAVASALRLSTKVILNEGSDYVVPANLFVITVGKTGAKKSPLLRNLIKEPLSLLETELNNKYKHEFADYLQAIKQGEQAEPPMRAMITVGDLTEESTQKQLEIQEKKGRSLLILRDELSGFFQSMNKYTKGKGSQTESLLEYFDGDGFKSIRLDSKGNTKVRSCSKSQVSLYGNIQDKILGDLIKNGDENGLWARNIFSPLPSNPVKLQVLSQQQKQEHREAKHYLQQFLKLIYNQMYFSYELSDEAQEVFFDYEFKKQVEAQATKVASHAGLLCKSAAKVGRVAGLLHIIENVAEPVEFISKDTVLAAITLVDFFDNYAINFQRDNTKSDEDKRMEKIQNICLRSKTHVAWRDIQQALSPTDRKKWNKECCIESIVKLEYMNFGEIIGGKKAGSIRYKATKPYKC
tara:strand:+ start:923 stop:3397 length:2475 start_codon:yes stop_codon:yes gene_type:complete